MWSVSVLRCMALQADRTLMAEQRKTDFRPPEDGEPPPLDRPTGACVLVAALLSRPAAPGRAAPAGLQPGLLRHGGQHHSACACPNTVHVPWLPRRPLHATQARLCF